MKRFLYTKQEAEEYKYPTIKGQDKAFVEGQCAYAYHYKWGIEIQCINMIKKMGYGPATSNGFPYRVDTCTNYSGSEQKRTISINRFFKC